MKTNFRRELRASAHRFEQEEFERITKLSELDQRGFWKVVNSRKSKKRQSTNADILFNNARATTTDELLHGWRGHYQEMYKFSNDEHFDNGFREKIEQESKHFLNQTHVDDSAKTMFNNEINTSEIQILIDKLPFNKSGSKDNLTYEHLKYGGHSLTVVLTNLFNKIIKLEQIPINFKSGLTVTLHKGKGKSTADPNNYRAISLLPVIFKLFEKVIMSHVEKMKIYTCGMQHGFQKGKNCKMVSFILQEARNYYVERGSSIHACYLDAKAAFDKVWISGLIHKLYHKGIKGKPLRIINDTLRGSTSQVLHNGHLSETFQIAQGTRQGSICAPFYYTIFVDDLLEQLTLSTYGLKINSLPVAAPTQADDIVLLSASRFGLQQLVNTCYDYAQKWRFSYNAAKCATMEMGGKRRRVSHPCQIVYGDTPIVEASSYTHLGTI